MTPDYGAMARGLTRFGVAALRTETRLAARWLELVGGCGRRFADEAAARRAAEGASLGGVAGAAGVALRDYARGVAALPDLALLDLAADLDAARRAEAGR
jgi:hypothetical protein